MSDDPPERPDQTNELGETNEADGTDEGDKTERTGETDGSDATDDDPFASELDRARKLLDGEGVEALHVGIVRDGEIDTTFAQRDDEDASEEGLRALALLGAHVRLVANEAGVDASTVAGDAATLAGQVEQIPATADDLPEE
ncbi:hypothetical protein [Halorubrum laminariae]|uniref:DUF8113 domain-containing protein n=1 Tax=Halorubrum laminariae TaxID=1433523 RepID=A0ABD6C263_9EURY|nr:hypothetical protein [Halorubrum laminariae]